MTNSIIPLSGNASTALAATTKNQKNVAETAKKFEAMYMTEMMGHMFEGIETDGPFGGGHGEEVFRSLMIEQYGKIIADSGQTGISTSLQREMLQQQELQQTGGRLVTPAR